MTVETEEIAELRHRLARLRSEISVELSTLSRHTSDIAEGFARLAEATSGADRVRYQARRSLFEENSSHFRAVSEILEQPWVEPVGGSAAPSTEPRSSAAVVIEDLVDPSSAEVARAATMARALVTARGLEDLGDYVELLTELKEGLTRAGRSDADDDTAFVLGLVGSLTLIGAVLVRSAERSGLETESGQPLLPELFQRLINADAHL